MGARGPGAVAKKPKPPAAKAMGRPSIKLAREIYEALREPTLRAIKRLDQLIDSADERTALLASKALAELGTKPPVEEEKPDEGAPQPMVVTVNYKNGKDYRASTG